MQSGFITGFDDGFAVVETASRTTLRISQNKIPNFAKIGDFLVHDPYQDGYYVDFAITEKRRREILRLADAFFE